MKIESVRAWFSLVSYTVPQNPARLPSNANWRWNLSRAFSVRLLMYSSSSISGQVCPEPIDNLYTTQARRSGVSTVCRMASCHLQRLAFPRASTSTSPQGSCLYLRCCYVLKSSACAQVPKAIAVLGLAVSKGFCPHVDLTVQRETRGLLDWRCLEVNANFLEVKTARRPL